MQPCAGSDALKPAAGGPRPAPLQRSRAVKGAAAAKPTRAVSSRRLKRPHTSEPSGRRSRQHSPPPAQLCSSGTAVRSPAARWTARKPPCVSSANPEGVRRVRSLPVTSGPPIKAQRDAADLRSSSLTPSSAPLPTSSESRSGRPRGDVSGTRPRVRETAAAASRQNPQTARPIARAIAAARLARVAEPRPRLREPAPHGGPALEDVAVALDVVRSAPAVGKGHKRGGGGGVDGPRERDPDCSAGRLERAGERRDEPRVVAVPLAPRRDGVELEQVRAELGRELVRHAAHVRRCARAAPVEGKRVSKPVRRPEGPRRRGGGGAARRVEDGRSGAHRRLWEAGVEV
mmetsp:Transcript_26789/g.80297  ORF Transcript_26789/g.80297 Transcript_26789/m.80297 type:complete len:345 (-) Transcript_26789:872-1906(-)